MNLPNFLTLCRIFFVPLLVAVLMQDHWHLEIGEWNIRNAELALLIFLLAAATDLLDGYLARRWRQETTVGTLLDPIADKLLISAALISLVQVGAVPAWMVILVVGREFAVSGLRSIAAAEGFTIPASELGKTKMVAQVVAVSLLLISIGWPHVQPFAYLVMWGVVLFAVISGLDYFQKFWRKVDTSVKLRRRRELLLMDRRRRREEALQRHAAASRSPVDRL
jgi:CDP-diacylglycerol---glycerol-3-phosphate 3-phosphatidyltransferase